MGENILRLPFPVGSLIFALAEQPSDNKQKHLHGQKPHPAYYRQIRGMSRANAQPIQIQNHCPFPNPHPAWSKNREDAQVVGQGLQKEHRPGKMKTKGIKKKKERETKYNPVCGIET